MTCEVNKHNFKVEPIQTVSRAINDGEVHSVTLFLQHCTLCGKNDEIAIHETQEYVEPI